MSMAWFLDMPHSILSGCDDDPLIYFYSFAFPISQNRSFLFFGGRHVACALSSSPMTLPLLKRLLWFTLSILLIPSSQQYLQVWMFRCFKVLWDTLRSFWVQILGIQCATETSKKKIQNIQNFPRPELKGHRSNVAQGFFKYD